ncbi:hypothetical protein [Polluticaenibacter yanchengensis]|uniref:Late embryogenesis abundant protein LEA-2 subgroup domain-containing protein n=1 Tax=Polluticaenibacter yanchengensis TaxID=3014562 RepID=A0ABT4UIA2_9BACT|nr:hypothetical protein [Chitinophagaceae bacterium LY-5]
MATLRNQITPLTIVLLASVFLTGCSFFADFFVLNTTDKEVTAIIKFQRPIDEYSKDSFSIQLKYADTVLVVNDKTQIQLTKKLNYRQINSTTLSITLPAKSTVLVGGSINRPISADSITLIKDNVVTDYSLNDIYKQTKKSGGLFPPFHVTYKIE